MIISHTHKFIFGKIRKVGSSSTEIFLKDFLNTEVDVWHGEMGYGDEESYSAINIARRIDPHTSINQILTPDIQQYYKCVVERNPWDQYLSMIDFQSAMGYDHYTPKRFFNLNYEIYLHNDVSIVDNIMRYEDLTNELNKFCEKFHLSFDKYKWNNMKYKGGYRKNKTHEFYKEHPDIKAEVEEAAWFHIEHLGYKFK